MKKLFKLNSITIMKFIICFMISSIMVCCDKNDGPDSNYPDAPEETEDPYLVNGLRYEIIDDNTCKIIGQKESDIPNHLLIPEKVEILGNYYSVTEIDNGAWIGKKSVQISNSITTVGRRGINGNVVQVIVGSNVSLIHKNSWSAIKVIWLTNTKPNIYQGNLYESGNDWRYVYGKVNYFSTQPFTFTDREHTYYYPYSNFEIANLSSLFWVDGILYTLTNPADRKCMAIGYDYSERISLKIVDEVEKDGVKLNVEKIGPFLLAEANELVNISGFKSVPDGMFYGCASLTSLKISMEVSELSVNAFNGCEALETIEILDSENMLTIRYDESITNQLNYISPSPYTPSPLFSTTSLSSLYIGRKIKYTTPPFKDLTSLETVTISDIETTIYNNEFYGCSNLKSLTIGNGVETIGSYAFSGCSSMETFTVGSGVKSIGADAFSDCTSLTSLTTQAIEPPTCGDQALDDIDKWNCKLYVPDESIDAYKEAPQWKNFLFIE